MSNMRTSNVQDNEILKAVDINDSFDAQITNIAKTMSCLLETKQDFIISDPDLVKAHSDNIQDWSIDIGTLFAISSYDGIPVLETEKTFAAANVTSASSFDRIDTVQIRGVYVNTDSEQRAFIDFDTKDKTLNSVFTKRELQMEVQILKNNVASVSAPDHTDGWIKIAEIYVPSSATKISDCTIYNITSDVAGLNNDNWTNEKNVTYNVQYISNVNQRFRNEHNSDGSHKNNIIHNSQLDIGTAQNQVNNANIVIGGEVTVAGEGIQASSSTLEAIQKVVSKINELYKSYKDDGDYNFAREVSIYGNATETITGDKLKIGINPNGSAYIKIGNKELLTILSDGTLRANSGFTPSNTNDLITKKVTDEINNEIDSIKVRVKNLEDTSDNTVYSNETLSRYTIDNSVVITLATTSNITLSGLQRIDNIDGSANTVILVKNQTNSSENGIYIMKPDRWIRHTNYDIPSELKGKLFPISDGKINKGKIYFCGKVNFIDSTKYGSDNIDFVEYMGSVNAIANKVPVRDATGHVKASASTNNEDCVIRSEIVSGAMKAAILDYVYPVGSLYWSSKQTSPKDLFGGTWQQITDTFILAAGSKSVNAQKYSSEGGSSSVTLNSNNLPQHIHGMAHTHPFTPIGILSPHKHTYTPSAKLPQHSHKFKPEGDVSTPTYSFNGSSVTTQNMNSNSYGYFDVPYARNDKYSFIRATKGVFTTGTGTYDRSIDMTTSENGVRVYINLDHTHYFVPKGSVTNIKPPVFTGTKTDTDDSSSTINIDFNEQSTSTESATFTGTESTTGTGSKTSTDNNTTTNKAIDITPPYLVRYCWERIA